MTFVADTSQQIYVVSRHTGEGRYPEGFEIPGFRVALAIASLPGMTISFCRKLQFHKISSIESDYILDAAAPAEEKVAVCFHWKTSGYERLHGIWPAIEKTSDIAD